MNTSILWLSFLITLFPTSLSLFWIIIFNSKKVSLKMESVMLVIYIIIVIVGWVLMNIQKINFFKYFENFKKVDKNLWLYLIVCVSIPLFEIWFTYLKKSKLKLSVKIYDYGNFFVYTTALFVGIVEEIIYRNVQYEAFKELINNYQIFIYVFPIASSVLFTFNHYNLTSNNISLAGKFMLSLVCSIVMINYCNIILCVVCHIMYNFSFFYNSRKLKGLL